MNYSEFLTVVVVHLLAVMSPGPDFAMITRNSLTYSRRAGVFCAVGLGLGILIHVTYSLLGVGLLIAKTPLLFTVLKYLCAGYLIYIGALSLFSSGKKEGEVERKATPHAMSDLAALQTGFFTNVLNPKATLFFFSLFTQVIDPKTPKWVQIVYGLEMSVVTFLWFLLVAVLFSHRKVKNRLMFTQYYLEKILGVILIMLGLKFAFV